MTLHEYLTRMTHSEKEADKILSKEAEEKSFNETKEKHIQGGSIQGHQRSDGSRYYEQNGMRSNKQNPDEAYKELKGLNDRRKTILKMLYDGKNIDEIYEEMKDEIEPSYKEKK